MGMTRASRWAVGTSVAALATLVVAGVVAAALILRSAPAPVCTLLAAEPGVTLSLDTAERGSVESVTVRVCDEEGCTEGQVPAWDDDRSEAFVRLPALRPGAARVTVTTSGPSGARTESAEVTLRMNYPNGERCGGGSPTATLLLTDSTLEQAARPS